MSSALRRLEITNGEKPQKLDRLIQEYAKQHGLEWSNSFVRQLIIDGVVFLARRQVRTPSTMVQIDQRVEIYLSERQTSKSVKKPSEPTKLRVLYEDDAILCIDKPAGLPSQPTLDRSRENAFDLTKSQFGLRYLGMHHRLDRDTSGVLLFTIDAKVNGAVAEEFSSHLCEKTYVAVVHGTLRKTQGRVESFLAEVNRRGKQAVYGSVKSGGKKAITDYLVLANAHHRSLVQVKITTGRTHQIRVHFSEMGHPIVGDTLYGSPLSEYNHFGRFLLHAHSLTIRHPITKNLVRIESPIPEAFRFSSGSGAKESR